MKKKFGVRSAECGVAALLLLLALTFEAQGAMVLVTRETFATVGTLDSGTPGNLGTVSVGSFYKRAEGPKVTGDTTANGRGWSADVHNTGAVHSVAQNFATAGMICGWYYFGALTTPNQLPSSWIDLLKCEWTANSLASIRITGDGNIAIFSSFGGTTGTPIAMPANGWIWFALAWKSAGGGRTDQKAYYKLPGGAVTLLGTGNSGEVTGTAQGGFQNVSGTITVQARYGMASRYTIATFTDVAYPSDVDEPPTTRATWYVNGSTGNDTNDGVTAGTPWLTVGKVNTESQYMGMLLSAGGMGSGDTLVIDGSTTPFDLGSASLTLQTQGLKVSCIGAEPIKPWKTISGTWALTATATKTYETTDAASADLASVTLWENDKWLNHPMGANLAAVLASLESTAGSFYSDGTKVYIHPFGDTNPSSDGKVYTRSRRRGAGVSAVLIQAPDVWVDSTYPGGGLIRKTTLVNATDNDPIGAYLVEWAVGGGGMNRLNNFRLEYFSKHAAGRTTSASNMSVMWDNLNAGQGSPYAGFGGQTQFVDFAASGTGNSATYTNCRSSVTTGVIGSTTGTVSQPSWISHGTGTPFTDFTFRNCQLPGGLSEQSVTTGYVTLFNSTAGAMTIGSKRRVVQLELGRRGRR